MRKSLLALCFILHLTCTYAQRISEIIIEPDTLGKSVTYGSTVFFRFYTINKKGKKKDVEYHRLRHLITCTNTTPDCSITDGIMSLSSSSSNKGFTGGSVRFYSIKTDELVYDKTFEIKFNFKDPTAVFYDGAKGIEGAKGSRGGLPVLLRDGKSGDQGGNGGNGENGKNITVKIKKEFDDYFKREIYFLYVTDEATLAESIYRCINPEKGVEINARGGDGGNGGSGGDGSKGKDGVKTETEDKRPGDGGNGGYGGNGGTGGTGGKVTVIAHTNASEILGYLRINNGGGAAGNAGRGGSAGSSGSAASGQSSGTSGKSGGDGSIGTPGMQGPNFELRVEEF